MTTSLPLPADLEPLRAALARGGSLAAAIVTGLGATPSWSVVDVVIQDEYTHDVIMTSAGDPRALVLDCT